MSQPILIFYTIPLNDFKTNEFKFYGLQWNLLV